MRPAVVFILITVVIDAMGIGLILPVMPELIREVEGTGLSGAAVWGGLLAALFAVMQFLFGPALGAVSDRWGRRPVLLVALVVMALDYLLMALAHTIWLLILGRVIGGITAATQATASAYMADVSAPQEKAANFGLIGAAFGVGFVLGPVIGGTLAEWGTRAPFYAAAALALANAVFGYVVLPETVTDRIRRPFAWSRANPVGAFRHIGALPGLNRLLIVVFLFSLAIFSYGAVWAYFGMVRFGWGPGMVGVSLAIYGVCTAIAQGLLLRPIVARLGERRTVILGYSLDIVAFAILGVIGNGWLAIALIPITGLASIAGPVLGGIMSRTAADDQQGELQGVLAAVHAVATVVTPLLMTQVFYAFTVPGAPIFLPGAPFVLAGLLLSGGLWLFVRTRLAEAATGD